MAWLSGWSKRVKVTVDNTLIDAELSWFPVLLYLSASSGKTSQDVSCIFDELQSDANRKKIAVTKADGETELYVEIEKWVDADETAWLWVSRDGWAIADDADTDLYIYYDADHADNDTYVGDTAARTEVWDGNFKAVWHLNQASDAQILDSTSDDRDSASNTLDTTAGKIGLGMNADGGELANFGDVVDMGTSDFTLEAWVKTSDTTHQKTILDKRGADDPWPGYLFGVAATGEVVSYACDTGGDSEAAVSTATVNDGEWYHVAARFDKSEADGLWVFIDGAQDGGKGKLDDIGTVDNAGSLIMGYHSPSSTWIYWIGDLDEIRISLTFRSAAWIKATYNSGNDSLLTYGSQQARYTQTVDMDILLQAQDEQTADLDLLLRDTDTQTAALDVLLATIENRTVDLDAILTLLGSSTVDLSSLLRDSDLKTVLLDVLLRHADSHAISLDALLGKPVVPVTIQPSAKDNYLYQDSATSNYGTQDLILVGWGGAAAEIHSLVEFPITWGTDIPVGATITSAALYLYYYNKVNDPVGRTYKAQRLVRLDWHETQSTWTIYKTGSNWTTAGAGDDGDDYTSDDEASAVVPAGYGWMEWDILNQVTWAQTNDKNVAFRVVDQAYTAAQYSYFYSREYAGDPSLCPKLVIQYTIPESTTVDLDALLSTRETAAAALDALLQSADSQAITLDALLRALGVASVDVDLFMRAADSTTVGLDVLLRALASELNVSLDVLVQALGITQTVAVDALIQAVDSATVDLDALVHGPASQTVSLDALVQELGLTRTVAIDALIATIEVRTVDLDAFLQAIDWKTVTLDTLVRAVGVPEQVDIDALLATVENRTVDLDVLIATLMLSTVSVDALLRGIADETITLDAYLRACGIVETVGLDALVAAVGSQSLLLDVLIAFRQTLGIDLDVFLRDTVIATVDLDGLIQDTAIASVALDCILSQRLGGPRYTVELWDASGNLVAVLQNAYIIQYEQSTNLAPTLLFDIPADDAKTTDITTANEIWLRDYETDTVVEKFRLNRREDNR